MIHKGVWRNIKNCRYYLVTGVRVDCTNSKDHLSHNEKLMVDYEDQDGTKWARSYNEFITKFIAVLIV